VARASFEKWIGWQSALGRLTPWITWSGPGSEKVNEIKG
jgi:hypothetical protein